MSRASTPKDALARVLSVRDVSVAEARLKLARLGVAEAQAAAAIRWACASGYLDDAKLAARLVERELARKPPVAPARIAAVLRSRGIQDDVAGPAVRAGAPREVVREAVARWVAGAGAKLAPRRLATRLMRAGHGAEEVADLVASVRAQDEYDQARGEFEPRTYED